MSESLCLPLPTAQRNFFLGERGDAVVGLRGEEGRGNVVGMDYMNEE